jgi:hypothetical protein
MLACGACGDAIFKATYWWATAPRMLFLVLLVSGAALIFLPRSKSWPLNAVAAFAALPVGFVGGMFVGFDVALWLASMLLLLSAVVSIVRRDAPRWFELARVGLILGATVIGVVSAWPSRRDTKELVDVALYVKKFPPQPSWISAELLSRAETRELIEQKLSIGGDPSAAAVELHRELGFPAELRRDACQKLRANEREKACPGEDR